MRGGFQKIEDSLKEICVKIDDFRSAMLYLFLFMRDVTFGTHHLSSSWVQRNPGQNLPDNSTTVVDPFCDPYTGWGPISNLASLLFLRPVLK